MAAKPVMTHDPSHAPMEVWKVLLLDAVLLASELTCLDDLAWMSRRGSTIVPYISKCVSIMTY